MLDIHFQWLVVLALNFLGLMVVLNILLFKPLLRLFDERKNTVNGALAAAREMNRRKEEGIESLHREIVQARGKAKEAYEHRRNEGLGRQKELLGESETRAAEMLLKAREDLRAETEKARQTLRADVEKFSDEIVRKLVKA